MCKRNCGGMDNFFFFFSLFFMFFTLIYSSVLTLVTHGFLFKTLSVWVFKFVFALKMHIALW